MTRLNLGLAKKGQIQRFRPSSALRLRSAQG